MINIKPSHLDPLFRVLPWLAALCIALFGVGLYSALVDSPPDYQQGETVRIMYVHVPAAWMSLMTYGIMAVASLSYLVWRNPLSDVLARSAAPIGAGFTLITLITGSLWGKPMWGTWWVWDARLTSVLILFFIYLGYMMLANSAGSGERGRKSAAILAIVGALNLPIIKFSVDWWNTLHQPASVIRMDGPTIDESMLTPLFLMFGAYLLFFCVTLLIRMRTMLVERKIARHAALHS